MIPIDVYERNFVRSLLFSNLEEVHVLRGKENLLLEIFRSLSL